MEASNISKLAALLRENGDKVLNALSKLSLSASLLQNLNEAFCLIVENDEDDNSSFQVIKTNNSKVEFFHDVQFLHDFVQKAVGLKLSHNPLINEPLKGILDISKFKNLKCLELRKVPVNLVSGIQGIRAQLQSVICVRCLQKLEDLLSDCGADHSSGFIWSELREAVFSYNTIESLDTSLGYTPWLQIIDLSHNRIRNVTAIDWLPNLKYLNIGYNLLDSIPVFNKSTCRGLQVLILKNNYIEDLSGLSSLENLSELDLSCNCLTDHDGLYPLLKLASLVWLSLEGNPLSFHARHRSHTAHYLHNNAAFGKFVLDRAPLSKSERLLIGTASSSPMQQRALVYGDNVSSHSASSSATSTKTQVPEQLEQQTAATSSRPQGSRSRRPVREAVISEHDGSIEEETDTLTGSLETSLEHLETKRQIETLRERFGEDKWLIQHGGSCVQNVLGLNRTVPTEPTTDLYQAINVDDNQSVQVKSRPEPSISVLPDNTDATEGIVPSEKKVSQSVEEISSEVLEADRETEDEEEEEMEEDDEAEQQLYTVQRVRPGTQYMEELFLAVTDRQLKERETHSGRTREHWALDTVQSCVRISSMPVTVQLTFDTIRRDRQEREYIMEEMEAQKLVRTLGNILDSRSLSAMNQVPYRCMKCSTQFSQELDSKNINTVMVPDPAGKVLTCPSCGSTMVIEMDEEPLPAQKAPSDVRKDKQQPPVSVCSPALAQSPSQSSIGGESLQVSAMVHQPDIPCASPQPALAPTRSAASLDSPNSNSVVAVQHYDSDIEVISNPSQSSIEVLEGESRTPGRKRSSEERQALVVSQSVVTAHTVGQALTLAGLTESSSSGSLTDSVCTTYEHQMPTAPEEKGRKLLLENGSTGSINIVPKKPVEETIEESNESPSEQSELFSKPHSPVKDFTAMFEGLLQSVSSKLVGAAPATILTAAAGNTMTYSYTDFCRVDHRIKLHLYQHVFEGESEDLVLLLRAEVLPQASIRPFPGCLVMSTCRVYVLKVNGAEGDDPEKWLCKTESFPLCQLLTLFVLPWNQGVGLELQEASSRSILFLIQDQQWTANFLSFVSDAPLPKMCEVRSEPPDYHQLALRQLLISSSPSGEVDSAVRVLAIFNSCTVTGEEVVKLEVGAMVITAADLIMTQDDLQWLFPANRSASLQAHSSHKMNDLIEVELDGLTLGLQFMDEAAGHEESWDVVLRTDSAVQTVITAIQVPWEQLFSVPLQVTNKTAS